MADARTVHAGQCRVARLGEAHLRTEPDVDAERIVLIDRSFGGVIAPRGGRRRATIWLP